MAKRTNLVKVLAAFGVGTIAAGAGLANLSASATTTKTIGGKEVSSFQMEYGASVRIGADVETGIRFKATLSDQQYTDLEGLEESQTGVAVNYGVLIVPADKFGEAELTVANIFDSGTYCLEKECSCTKTHLAAVEYEKLANDSTTDGVMNLRGSLEQIQKENLTREFVGLAYIEYSVTADETTTSNYVFADYALPVDENDQPIADGTRELANTTRSMTYVAQKAIEDEEVSADEATTLTKEYITPLAGNKYKYTINHYLPDDDSETPTYTSAPVPETVYAELSTGVTAANIAKSTLTNKAEYASYATYGTDTTKSNASGIVYANGKTVLNNYYVARDTVLFDGGDGTDFANLQTAFTKGNSIGVLTKNVTYEGKDNLTKVVLDGENKQYGAGYLNMGIADEKIDLANNANWDYLTVTMCVTTTVDTETLPMYSKNRFLGNVAVGEWVDFVIPKATLNTSNSYLGKNFASKADVDSAFSAWYGMAQQDNQANYSHYLFYTNLESLKYSQTGTNVTYYIDKITWDVDVTAPVISGSNAKIFTESETVNYVPTATIADDYNIAPTSTFEMYSVDGDGVRTLLEAVDGSYALTKGTNYVLVITAQDSPVSDMVGNVTTKEYPVQICSVADGLTFDSDAENGYLKNGGSAWAGVTSTVGEWKNSVTFGANTATGVLSYHSDCSATKRYGGYLHLNFSEAQIADILSKFYLEDGTTVNPDFKLTFNMAVSLECLADGATVYLVNKNVASSTNGPMATLEHETWVTVEVSSSTLINEGWTSTANITKYLNGTSALWYIQNDTIPSNNAGALTYYFDSISWTGSAE